MRRFMSFILIGILLLSFFIIGIIFDKPMSSSSIWNQFEQPEKEDISTINPYPPPGGKGGKPTFV